MDHSEINYEYKVNQGVYHPNAEFLHCTSKECKQGFEKAHQKEKYLFFGILAGFVLFWVIVLTTAYALTRD